MVWFDGQYLAVNVVRRNYKPLLELAEKYPAAEYLKDVNIYLFPPIKNVAKKLHEFNLFDKSAEIFIQKSEIDTIGLYDYQKQGIRWLGNDNNHKLLGDVMGLGKSVQAAGYLRFFKETSPAIIICPASLKLNWQREIKKWALLDSTILSGMNPFDLSEKYLKKYPVIIINYDIMAEEDKKLKALQEERISKGEIKKRKNLPLVGWVEVLQKIPIKTIIVDEVQYIANDTAIRTRAVIELCEKVKAKRIFLSGTPYESKTKQFFTCLNLINKSLFPNKWKFLWEYCNPKKGYIGWTFDGLTNGDKLHELVSTVMLRRYKEDVLKELPPKQRIIIPIEVNKSDFAKYLEIDNELVESISKKELKGLDINAHISKLKRGAYEAKKRGVIRWIKDYLEVSDKLVAFVYHVDVFEELKKEFGKIAVGINGGTSTKDRQDAVDKFQKNKKIKLFIGQIKAAGVGLTLTAANAVAFIEFGQTVAQHVQAEDRIHRISQLADSVTAYYLIALDSVDEDVMELLNKRSDEQGKVMDGKDSDKMFAIQDNDFAKNVYQNYKKRKGL